MEDKTKNAIELALDIGLVLVALDICWVTIFKQEPPVKFFHDYIAILGTVAAGVLVWKLARKNRALT